MAELEAGFRDDLEEEQAKALVAKAVLSGVYNDMGSGNNVDLVVIKRGQPAQVLRPYLTPNPRKYRKPEGYSFPPGTTPVLRTTVEVIEETVEPMAED
eukprot:NODE_2687_length_455_cov_381.072289_g2666_i0.p1 GENE.NODE_2687_length_455_cov_381.072289_g2666_i0~~NODE_2687_length_455_cov_381.072289_g2666_i0.p1  ORF type:complete len:111 (+),score=28.61 NODE_2687_length_455_cov_381.072289_g2666_i0:40-333(+)